jgi:glycosyltransferase involved in cell wall biosynthesis
VKKPRIVVDGRMVTDVPHGIARYVRMIAKGLADRSTLAYEPVFLASPGNSAQFAGFETVELRTPFLDPKEMATIPIALWKAGAKLYHSPSFSALVSAPCPWVVTLHDLNHLTYGGPMERAYYETVLRSFAARAKKVVTISEFSRGEILRWHARLNPTVVVNAIDPIFLKAAEAKSENIGVLERHQLAAGKYFVCLSNEKPHKNVETLVRAFDTFRSSSAEAREYRLVLTMRRYADQPGVVAAGGISDSEVAVLVRHSRAMVFPSVYEGFGLPPLEGAVLGAPVIVSDIPAHREALRDLGSNEARWVKPLAEDGWAEALRSAARSGGEPRPVSEATRAKLIDRYSVKRMGDAMDRIYRDVLGIK